MVVSASLLLTGCSIKDDSSNEQKVTISKPTQVVAKTKTQRFINKCTKCILGDLSELDDIIATYKSSFTPKTTYPKGAFLYQKITPTLAFERCAQKAMLLGDNRAYKEMFIRQGKIARSARYFYATNKPTQGAFWLQRLVNIKGEMDAYEIAGRVFIQDLRTISIGSRLLEQSARLGNRNARQMLLGLMHPGSVYYRQITQNSFKGDEADQSNEAIDKFDAQLDENSPAHPKSKKDLLMSKGELLANQDEDEDNRGPAFFTLEPPKESDNTQEARTDGTIPIMGSNNGKAQVAPAPKGRDIREPQSLRLGYYDAAFAQEQKEQQATSQEIADPKAMPAPVVSSQAQTINALESGDPELDVPLEVYPSAKELKAKEQAATATSSAVDRSSLQTHQMRAEQIAKERAKQRQDVQSKVEEAVKAVQQRTQKEKEQAQ